MSKFYDWEKDNLHFVCSKCGADNKAEVGERLGFCSCGNGGWFRKEVEQ